MLLLAPHVRPGSEFEAFSWGSLPAAIDALLVASYFCMREIELAGAAGDHLYFRDGLVHLLLPVHKTATQGKLTERSLGCGCTVKQQPLCPFHAATRHLQRLEILQGSLDLQSVPLFPSDYGKVLEKSQVISLIRQTLRAAGATATRQDEVGNLIERFGGHVLLVAGAQHLYLLGLRWDLVQLHGRWSSVAVQRYLQEAPLLQVPGHLFAPRSPDWSRTGSKEPSWHQMHDRRPWHLAPLPWRGGRGARRPRTLVLSGCSFAPSRKEWRTLSEV